MNSLQMIQKMQWPHNSKSEPPAHVCGNWCTEVFESWEDEYSFWIESYTGENMGKFSAEKAVQSSRQRLGE